MLHFHPALKEEILEVTSKTIPLNDSYIYNMIHRLKLHIVCKSYLFDGGNMCYIISDTPITVISHNPNILIIRKSYGIIPKYSVDNSKVYLSYALNPRFTHYRKDDYWNNVNLLSLVENELSKNVEIALSKRITSIDLTSAGIADEYGYIVENLWAFEEDIHTILSVAMQNNPNFLSKEVKILIRQIQMYKNYAAFLYQIAEDLNAKIDSESNS